MTCSGWPSTTLVKWPPHAGGQGATGGGETKRLEARRRSSLPPSHPGPLDKRADPGFQTSISEPRPGGFPLLRPSRTATRRRAGRPIGCPLPALCRSANLHDAGDPPYDIYTQATRRTNIRSMPLTPVLLCFNSNPLRRRLGSVDPCSGPF